MTFAEAMAVAEWPGFYGQKVRDYEMETPEYRYAHCIGWTDEDEAFYQQERAEWLAWWYSDN